MYIGDKDWTLNGKCCEESVIWKTMDSFLLKTKECLDQTRQYEERVGILKQEDDEFFVKKEVAMLKIHPRSLETSVGHFV
jgi:hypothetical protein